MDSLSIQEGNVIAEALAAKFRKVLPESHPGVLLTHAVRDLRLQLH